MTDSASGKILASLRCLYVDNAEQRKQAEAEILAWQKKPGFCTALLNILGQTSEETDIKVTLAVLHRTVSRYWLDNREYTIPVEEKNQLRTLLLNVLLEDNNLLTRHQLYNTLSVIAKRDFPNVWPNVFNTISQYVLSADRTTKMKGLQLLYQSIKAIGERDTSEDDEYGQGPPAKLKEKALGDLSPQLWTMVANIWVESHTALLSLMSNLLQDPQNNVLIEQTHMTGLQCNISLKILQLLVTKFLDILFSYSEDMTTKFFSEVLNMLTHSVICCNALHTINIEGVPKKVMHSIILGILKLLNCTQANNTLLFVPFLEPFLQFYLKEFEAELAFGDDAVFQEKYYVQIITFLADILSTSEYNVSDVGTEIPVAKAIILKLFTKDTILGLTRQTIFKYLKLTPKMLELWQEDAEEFILEEMSDAYQDKLQPCAEYFFFWLLRVDPSVLPQIGKVITTWIVDSDKKGTQGDTNFLLNKESCYFAFSLCGNDFRTPNDIQFRTFFLEHVLKYFPGQHMIVKRRIAYAIHMWSRQIQEEKLVRQAFEILIACFGVEDLVCRLWAAMSFKTLLAEFNFKSPKLVRYLGPAMEGVLKLVEVMNGGPITG
eukprot:TRINITY_DN5960_c0_g1_i33.p1 TRINITY_DN5960_c0_g1~~TRINITY_DN5960_c0_g1_i33.p1  ORF type:complete len:603 (+),score=112.73 TRINITY_DN5960_c0_g1_i33:55-1863(+)